MGVHKGPWQGAPLQDDGEPPDNGNMEGRVKTLEADMRDVRERLIKIEAKLDNLPAIFATKADLSEAKTSIIMWVVGAIFLAQLLPALLKKFGL
jgi:hypothetical protein